MQIPHQKEKNKEKITIIGCGKLGANLAASCLKASYPIDSLISNSPSSVTKLAKNLKLEKFNKEIKEAQIIFITTPDDKIENCCKIFSEKNIFTKNMIIAHCSGALSSKILKAAKKNHAKIASFHPMQSFASKDNLDKNLFKDIYIAIEGDKKAVSCLKALAKNLESKTVLIEAKDKEIYHAAGVVASNYFASIFNFAVNLLTQINIDKQDAQKLLLPLVKNTLANIQKNGIENTLTGPIARADMRTIKTHLANLNQKDLILYKTLGIETAHFAYENKMIKKNEKDKLIEILK